LATYVSSVQYLLRTKLKTIQQAVSAVEAGMRKRLADGFVWRLSGTIHISPGRLAAEADAAATNLAGFWLVGVVEQYDGFVAALGAGLDPAGRHPELWAGDGAKKQKNTSKRSGESILARVDSLLVADFNRTLVHEWRLYGLAKEL
ncbi:unnamed protein product, partial [Phaeothamnion confervicola]